MAGLVEVGGVFYGTTLDAVKFPAIRYEGCGIVFKMTRVGADHLHAFDYDDGRFPSPPSFRPATEISTAQPIEAGTWLLCARQLWTVFRITGSGNLTTSASLEPAVHLIAYGPSTNGNLYGTTADGTIFKLSPGGN